jgi:opacity protein-like surface antigen
MFLLVPLLASAQGYSNSRAQSWDFSIGAIYQQSVSTGGQNGSSLEVDSALGLGFNIAYNFSERFAIGGDFEFLQPDYKAVLADENDPENTTEIRHEFSQFNGRLKATLNFLDGPFVPFVEAGAGWTYIDSNVADGPPITGCWWDPWWGYICEDFYSTFSETSTTYGGNLGFRYEMRGNSFLKLSYNYWIIVTSSSPEPELQSLRFDYGWRF